MRIADIIPRSEQVNCSLCIALLFMSSCDASLRKIKDDVAPARLQVNSQAVPGARVALLATCCLYILNRLSMKHKC